MQKYNFYSVWQNICSNKTIHRNRDAILRVSRLSFWLIFYACGLQIRTSAGLQIRTSTAPII